MGWLLAVGILLLIAVMPTGVCGSYDRTGFSLYVKFGPFKWRLLPGEKKKKKTSAPKQKRSDSGEKDKKQGGSVRAFYPVLRLTLDFLGKLRRKLRVRKLMVHITMAGDDPSNLAVNYGRAWAAVGNILPHLERSLSIKERDIRVQCDFTAEKTVIYAFGDAFVPLYLLIYYTIRYGMPVVREYLNLIKQRKGGAAI